MRILFVLMALFTLSGCETMEFTAVDYHHGYNYGPSIHTAGYISYTLGYYSDSYYNGYRVYGTHGHRYYHAPRNYRHHRHFTRPVVVHQHVHTSYCEHNYRPRNHHTPPVVVRTPPRHTPPRHTRNDRNRNHDRRDRRDDDRGNNRRNDRRDDRRDRDHPKREHH